MVDNMNPTSQFHPYTPETSTPQASKPALGGLGGILNKIGLDPSKIDAMKNKVSSTDVRGGLQKARGVARNNGGLVLGGLAALAIGAGLMRKRSAVR
jgi:hypothetical protein